jgi:GNAT superfamily N-acetyltransferase
MPMDQQFASLDEPPVLLVRPAGRDDLRAASQIYAVNEMAMRRRMHPLTRLAETDEAEQCAGALADLGRLHVEDPRQVLVAQMAEEIIGVSAAAFREHHAHIQYLFVAPNAQTRGVGSELLRRLYDAASTAGCSIVTLQTSDDPRALIRYLRLGLFPQPPNVVWRADDPSFPELGFANSLEATPLHVDDYAALNTVGDIDKAVRGVRRRQDIEHWLQEGALGSLLVHRSTGKPAGYFLVAVTGDKGRIGPVAAIDEVEFGNVFANALAAAKKLHHPGTIWKLASPGENHAAISALLPARFRPAYTMPFFASRPIGRFDRYIFHDLDLL